MKKRKKKPTLRLILRTKKANGNNNNHRLELLGQLFLPLEWDEDDRGESYGVHQDTHYGILQTGSAVKVANDLEDDLIEMIDTKKRMGIR